MTGVQTCALPISSPNGWVSNSNSNEWVSIDLNAPFVVNRLTLKGIDNEIKNFRLEAADDVSFTTGLIVLQTDIYPSIGEPVLTFDFPANNLSKQYYRIFIIDTYLPVSGRCAFREWELFSITGYE